MRILKISGLFIFLAFVGMYPYSIGTTADGTTDGGTSADGTRADGITTGKFADYADHEVISRSEALPTSVLGALPLFYNTDAVEGMAIAYPDTLPLPFDQLSCNAHAISVLSSRLTSVERLQLRYFSGDFILKILVRKILFPFHSFW